MAVEIDPTTLEVIQIDNRRTDDCFTEVLTKWLRSNEPSPCWKNLTTALQSVEIKVLLGISDSLISCYHYLSLITSWQILLFAYMYPKKVWVANLCTYMCVIIELVATCTPPLTAFPQRKSWSHMIWNIIVTGGSAGVPSSCTYEEVFSPFSEKKSPSAST